MDNPRLEYQKMIDQTTSIYATIYSGIVVFGLPQVMLASSNKYSLLIFVGTLLFAVSSVWWLKVKAWDKLLKAEIKFKMEHDKEFKKYNKFIEKELKRKKDGKGDKDVVFTNYADDLIPIVLFFLSSLTVLAAIVMLCWYK